MIAQGFASSEERYTFAHDLAMAYMTQQDCSKLSPTEYYKKFISARAEIYEQIKDAPNPYRP